jgi:hypothetical protein
MGIELELAVLLMFSVIGQSTFARFEIETPAIRKIVKWFAVAGITLALYGVAGHWSLLVPVALGAAGTTFHIVWCRRKWDRPDSRDAGAQVLRTARLELAPRRGLATA